MDTFGLRIIASDKVFFNGRCKKLTIPAPDGEKGVLAHHENMVIAVVVGIARMESTEGEVTEIAVGTGFAATVWRCRRFSVSHVLCVWGQVLR